MHDMPECVRQAAAFGDLPPMRRRTLSGILLVSRSALNEGSTPSFTSVSPHCGLGVRFERGASTAKQRKHTANKIFQKRQQHTTKTKNIIPQRRKHTTSNRKHTSPGPNETDHTPVQYHTKPKTHHKQSTTYHSIIV